MLEYFFNINLTKNGQANSRVDGDLRRSDVQCDVIVMKLLCCWDQDISEITRWTSWWRHQMEAFSALLAIRAGNSPVPGEFSTQRPMTRSFDVFLDLNLNKRLSKQSWGWWFETPSLPLKRHRYWPFVRGIHQSPVNFPHKGQWRGALMFSLIWILINGWVNNREAGDLRRHRSH